MLIQFRVGNYRSFKDPVTLSMVAANIKSKPEELDLSNVIHAANDLSLLTSAAIYGANASGKSNLIRAMSFMRSFVLNSSRETQANDKITIEPFRLSTETDGKPSLFEMIFLHEGKQYRYGFEATTERVVAEWLYAVPTRREVLLFERKGDEIEVNSRQFKEGRDLQERTRSNALLLSVAAQFNGKVARQVLTWFTCLEINTGLNDGREIVSAMYYYEDNRYKDKMMSFVKQLDIGVEHIQVEKKTFQEFVNSSTPLSEPFQQFFDALHKLNPDLEGISAKTTHKKFDAHNDVVANNVFDLEQHESEGTKKIFALAYPVIVALHTGRIFIIDEFDARLHPLITCAIIQLFNNKETNPHGAQLIFATHDTNLLNSRMFRRDQIWFVEKSRQGFSDLYSLVEYRVRDGAKIRNDASFEKDYIEGRYGAIPFIGDLSSLIGVADEQETVAA